MRADFGRHRHRVRRVVRHRGDDVAIRDSLGGDVVVHPRRRRGGRGGCDRDLPVGGSHLATQLEELVALDRADPDVPASQGLVSDDHHLGRRIP